MSRENDSGTHLHLCPAATSGWRFVAWVGALTLGPACGNDGPGSGGSTKHP
jgi:hypothetical protein